MNKRQRVILEFLAKKDPSDWITQKEISEETGISLRAVGSECAKLSKEGFLGQDGSLPFEPPRYRISALGQNQLDNDDERQSTQKLMKKTTNATIALAIATVALALSTIWLAIGTSTLAQDSRDQTDMLRQDFDINNRPWIGGNQFRIVDNFVLFDVKNFGNLPNTNGHVQFGVVKNGFTPEHLYGNSSKTVPLEIIMPSQEITITLSGDIMNAINETRHGQGELFLGLEMNYTYGNHKSGMYGVVGKYNSEKDTFDILDTWVR